MVVMVMGSGSSIVMTLHMLSVGDFSGVGLAAHLTAELELLSLRLMLMLMMIILVAASAVSVVVVEKHVQSKRFRVFLALVRNERVLSFEAFTAVAAVVVLLAGLGQL